MFKSVILFLSTLLVLQHAIASPWCSAIAVSEKTRGILQRDADKRSTDQPRAIALIHTEGTLPHQGLWDQSVAAKQDLPLIRNLALIWRSNHDKSTLDHLATLLDAWSTIYQPSYNPIDETDFDILIDAYAITQAVLPTSTRTKLASLVRAWGEGYLDQMQRRVNPNRATWKNNWQSHRIKLATLAAAALDDTSLFDKARNQFRIQLNQNLGKSGLTLDFQERDALHYVVYDLEPLVRAAMAAKTRGEDWLNLTADNGATLAAGLDWLLPYAQGKEVHEEYVHSKVKFDYQRQAAGVKGFSGQWDPKSSAQLYWMASLLDTRYLSTAQAIAKKMPWLDACW
jgi:hypothetical protein